jgi:hypothetical protein
MEYAFPSRFEPEFLSTGETVTLLLAAFFTVGALVGLCLTYSAKPSPNLVSFWFAAAAVSPFGLWLAHGTFENNWRHATGASPWLNASFWTVLTTSIIGAFLADIRLANAGRQPCLYRLLRYSLYIAATICLLMCLSWFFTPAISEAPLPARRSRCKNNLKQIAVALHNYHEVHKRFPAAQISTPPISWRVQTLPFITKKELWLEYAPELSWDSSMNDSIAKTLVPTFNCPSRELHVDDKDNRDRYFTDYAMLTGGGAFSGHNKATRMRDIVDGTSNTLAIVEATGLNIVWTEPRDANTTWRPFAINYSGNEQYDSEGIASSWHGPGAHALFADGEIRFLSEKLDPNVLKALTTKNGEEEIPWPEVEKR